MNAVATTTTTTMTTTTEEEVKNSAAGTSFRRTTETSFCVTYKDFATEVTNNEVAMRSSSSFVNNPPSAVAEDVTLDPVETSI